MKKYSPRVQLWDVQAIGLKKMRGREYFALTMAMRTGKTPVALADFGELEAQGKVQDLLVVAPGGAYRTWEGAIEEHLSPDLVRRLRVHTYRSGAGAKERRERDAFMDLRSGSSPRALLINVEALSISKKTNEARDLAKKFLSQRKSYAVVDESTVIKNKSKRTKFINAHLRPLASYRRILSGLPSPKDPLDLFHQYEFLDSKILGFPSRKSLMLWAAHTEQRQFGGRWLATVIDKTKGDNGFRPECVARMRELIEPHTYRVEFRPQVPTTYSIRDVEMTSEQKRLYNEMKAFATTKLASDDHVTATVVIAQLVKMHQILVGHVADENGVEHHIKENRTAALMELLEDYSGKAVIWFTYTYDLEKVASALREEHGPASVARFYGGNADSREEDERRFKADPECRFMLATPGAGGMGRTWSVADMSVYYSSADNLEHRDQSEQRTMGVKKDRGVDCVDLICRGTVEEKILEALRKKINLSSAINGDNYKEWLI